MNVFFFASIFFLPFSQFSKAYHPFHPSFLTQSPVGPARPRNPPNHPQTRYATSSFQKPRPQLINPAGTAYATHTILENKNPVKSDALWREAIAPLPSTKQRPGFKIGFFEQGIITGVSLTLISLVATVSTLGYYTWTYVKLRI
jgi:hypothetical protein